MLHPRSADCNAGQAKMARLPRSMLPLRALALASNFFFIAYSYLDSLWPVSVLHTCMLPFNAKRQLDMRKLTTEIKKATETSPVSQWLLPLMARRAFKAGAVLFHLAPSFSKDRRVPICRARAVARGCG